MANIISGQIIAIGQKQTIAPKNGQGNALIKREFVICTLGFDPNDGTPELNERNTPILEVNGQDRVAVLDGFKVGDFVKVYFYVEGRKVVNQDKTVRYFNSIRASRIEPIRVNIPQQSAQPAAQPTAQPAAQEMFGDRPF